MPMLLLRHLSRKPAHTLAAITIAAVGTALATLGIAIFDTIQWRPLPFPAAGDVVVLYGRHESRRAVRTQVNWSFPRAQFVSRHATGVERVRPEGRRAATLAAVGSLVLFVLAMANLGALQMSSAVARRRESAVTLAMGRLTRGCGTPWRAKVQPQFWPAHSWEWASSACG